MSQLALAPAHPTEDPDIVRLVEAARDGDKDAFSQLYRRYHRPLYGLCYSIVRDHALAEDAAHDTCLRAMTNIDRFESGRPIWPWLAAIARRRSIDLLRLRSRTECRGDLVSEDTDAGHRATDVPDEPFEYVLTGEVRREIRDALRTLPARQRRAVLLYALEGWAYSEIADAEGISVTAVKSIIWRARGSLRRLCESRAMSALLAPVAWVTSHVRGASERIRSHSDQVSPLTALMAQPVIAVTLGLTLLLGPGVGARGLAEAPSEVAIGATGAAGDAVISADAGSTAPTIGGAPGEGDLERVTNDVLDPSRNATPDNTQFTSIVAAGGYASSHTLFAAGKASCWKPPCDVLFRSDDGGASWTRLPAEGFAGDVLFLPPAFPRDPRIFALGAAGLQRSDDGGRSFATVAPAPAFKDAQMSPEFNEGDPRILIGSNAVLEYNADRQLIGPTLYGVPGIGPASVSFSPSYALDGTVLVGGTRAADGQLWASLVNRCTAMGCTEQVLEGAIDVPSIRSAPQGSAEPLVAAFTEAAIFVSEDEGGSFHSRTLPEQVDATRDAVFLSTATGVRLVVATQGARASGAPAVISSHDGGRTWITHTVDVTGFELGATHLSVTPTGRLFAAGSGGGLACSSDGGATWSARCEAEGASS